MLSTIPFRAISLVMLQKKCIFAEKINDMKKLIFLIILCGLVMGCEQEYKVHYNPSFKDDFALKERRESLRQETLMRKSHRSFEEIDEELKDWPFPGANGNWIPSRDGLDNSDTIVDGFPYNRVI